MPAPPSSLIDPAIGHLVELAAGATGEQPGLPGLLARVADPRHPRGVRHQLAGLLGLALCAVVAGARSFTAIAEWAADADGQTLRMHDPYQRRKLSALAEQPVEVYCQCDPELAARRYSDRARTCHPIHVQASVPPDVRAEYDQPVGIGKLVTVDTAIPVDVLEVAAAVRARLPTPPGSILAS